MLIELEENELTKLIYEARGPGKHLPFKFGGNRVWLDEKDEAAKWAIDKINEWRNPVQI